MPTVLRRHISSADVSSARDLPNIGNLAGPFLTLPARIAPGAIPVQWSSVEDDSGIRGYDLEVSADGGASWTYLLTETQDTGYTFPGTPGVAYTFRLRATDNVNNTSAWAQAEVKTVIVKKYYSIAGQRVAMRSNGVLYYLHSDHLGSTSLTTNETGAVVAEQRYYPYGEVRWVTGTLATDFAFTGQRQEDFGLYDHHARFYSPKLGRFISPDTMVPDPTNFMEFSRYGYCLGNPIKYIDPTGHQIVAPNLDFSPFKLDITSWPGWAKTVAFLAVNVVGGHYEAYYEERSQTLEGIEAVVTVWMENEFRDRGIDLEEPRIIVRSPTMREGMETSMVAMTMRVDAQSDFVRAVPENQVGTSQPFKLRKGEDGISVFENVLPEQVLAELPGGQVPNTTVIIPQGRLPPGTQVVPTPAPGLSQFLSDAHRILIRPIGWSVDKFAKELKKIVGWLE